MKRPPASRRTIVSGATGSGKTTLLREGFAAVLPRALVLDFIGREWPAWPDADTVDSVDRLHVALRARVGRARWRLVVVAEADSELTRLVVDVLSPRAGRPSYVAGAGGVALICDEVHELAPSGRTWPEARRLWTQGRHVGLSILAGTQRLALIDRTVTAQSELFAILRAVEPRDLDNLAAYVPPEIMAEMRALPDWESIVWDQVRREGWRLAGRERGFQVLQRYGAGRPKVS